MVDGFEVAKKATLEFLETFKTAVVIGDQPDREILKMVARTTLRTKVIALYFTIFLWKQMYTYIPRLTQNLIFCSCMNHWLIS